MSSDGEINKYFKDFILKKGRTEEEKNRKARTERISSLALKDFSTFRVLNYHEESKSNFINGCFRSCIISSAIAVDQMLKYFLISTSEDWEETYWEIEMRKIDFHEIIERIKKTNVVPKEILSDAHWLRQIRNKIAVHPTYIGNPFELRNPPYVVPREPEEFFWAIKVMLRDIRKLLQFTEPAKRKEFEESKISSRNARGEILSEITLKDFLQSQGGDFGNVILWGAIQESIMEELAYEAYAKSVKIINTILSVLERKYTLTEQRKT
jgi:hypothetical protein